MIWLFDSWFCNKYSSTFNPGHVTNGASNRTQIDYEANGEVNVFIYLDLNDVGDPIVLKTFGTEHFILNCMWCSQGLREAIKNGDCGAVKKLLNEV